MPILAKIGNNQSRRYQDRLHCANPFGLNALYLSGEAVIQELRITSTLYVVANPNMGFDVKLESVLDQIGPFIFAAKR